MGNIAAGKHELEKPRRRSIRLKEYDYSQPGAYFVTVCVNRRRCILAHIRDENVVLSRVGAVVQRCWEDVPNHFSAVELDAFVIMPNHLHGILVLHGRGVQLNAPTPGTPVRRGKHAAISPKRNTLSVIIRTFKAAVTTQCGKNRHPSFKWQRNYYEHIIRNEAELNRIRQYILYNPTLWQFDRENPERVLNQLYERRWGDVFETVYGKLEGRQPGDFRCKDAEHGRRGRSRRDLTVD
jgi:REP element-mobilizing transposase RayT